MSLEDNSGVNFGLFQSAIVFGAFFCAQEAYMNGLTVFKNEKFGAVRTMEINGEVWFVGKDVAEALGYSDLNKAIVMHVDEEDKLNDKLSLSFNLNLGQRGGWIINESGLYSLILSSKLPTAKEFKRWVTSEVLPSIRKTGEYSMKQIGSDYSAHVEAAKLLREIGAEYEGKSKTFKQILDAHATKQLTGEFLLPLPKSERKTFSATEIGAMVGLSAQKVGKIANDNGLKTDEFGEWVRDKSPYSNKEVETFRYYENIIDKLKGFVRIPIPPRP